MYISLILREILAIFISIVEKAGHRASKTASSRRTGPSPPRPHVQRAPP